MLFFPVKFIISQLGDHISVDEIDVKQYMNNNSPTERESIPNERKSL